MSSDDGDAAPPAARRYNAPRRYPVPAPDGGRAATAPAGPETAGGADAVTRENPTLAEAEADYRRGRPAPAPAPPAPAAYPPGPGPRPEPSPAPRRRPAPRVLLLGLAIVAVLAVVLAIVVSRSGSDPATPRAAGRATGETSPATTSSAAPSSAAPSAAVSPTGSVAPGAPAATEICANLGSTPPFAGLVAALRPAEAMPESYVEPQSGVKVAACVGLFRVGAAAGRGRLAYLAEYRGLAATQYGLTLKTLGWRPTSIPPSPTYRNNFTTTVSLVQQGTSLVTLVGTGQ